MNLMKSALTASVLSMIVFCAAALAAQEGAERRVQSFRFTVTADGDTHDLGSWSKVSGLDVTWDIAEYRSNGAANVSRWHFPGNTKYGTVKLSRASSSESDLVIVWLRHIAATGDSPALAITLLDQSGDAVARWQLDNVVPRKYTVGGLNAEGTDVAIESLVISHEGLRVVCDRAC